MLRLLYLYHPNYMQMNKQLLLFLLVWLCFRTHAFATTEKYEAENGTRTGEATIATSVKASGGKYVQMKGGNLSFSVEVKSAGLYNMKVVFSQTYGDTKTQNLQINGEASGSIIFPSTGSSLNFGEVVSVVQLQTGTNTIAITKFWGWVDIDYIQLSAYQKSPFDIDPHPVTPNPTEGASGLYKFLRDNFQQKIVSGVMTGDVLIPYTNDPVTSVFVQNEVKFVYESSGRYPVIVGMDFLMSTGKDTDGVWFRAYTESSLAMAQEIWKAGGIPTFSWHWRDPSYSTGEFYTDKTAFDLTTAFTDASCKTWDTQSSTYKAIIRDIDIISGLLKRLQDKGVSILWRPLHEASGGWFWWGAKGAAPCVQLYRLVFDRMVHTHGLNNLIWVWNADGADAHWYPGGDVVDIIGRDYYYSPNQKNHSSLIGEFEALKNSLGTNKLLALTENSSIPYPQNMQADGAGWSYFMPWNGEHTHVYNIASDWNKIMNDPYVITLDRMPGWDGSAALEKRGSKSQQIYIENGLLIVQAKPGSQIYIADLFGRTIHTSLMTNDRASLCLRPGGYVVVVNGEAEKVFIPIY